MHDVICDGTDFEKFVSGQRCKLKVLESGFGNVGYGLAVQKGSLYAEELSIKILKYRETGKFDELEDTWITKKANCTAKKGGTPTIGGDTEQITMKSLYGLLYIMIGAFLLAVVVLVLEWIWACAVDVNPEDPKVSTKSDFRYQTCLLLHCWFDNAEPARLLCQNRCASVCVHLFQNPRHVSIPAILTRVY
jgi:hypothetical protein